MAEAKKLMGLLNDLYDKAEKCFNFLIDHSGKDGVLDVDAKMNTKYSCAPMVCFKNADGDEDYDYLHTVTRGDGEVIFIFDSEVYCTIRDIEPAMFIILFEELCFEFGHLDPTKIEDEIFK